VSVEQRLKRLHQSLSRKRIPHAFGGAIALGFCVEDPRGTVDLDVNVFVGVDAAKKVFDALPRGVNRTTADLERAIRDGQVRLRWGDTPIDLFFSYHPFHEQARSRTRLVPFVGTQIRVLNCTDLAVFKALFGRSKDWVDIETAAAAGSVDRAAVSRWISELLGSDDPRLRQLALAFSRADETSSELPNPLGGPERAICGEWMPRVRRRCGRRAGHAGAHR
jgi:hypothetical protein